MFVWAPMFKEAEHMPESIPAPLVIDTLKDTFKEARVALAAEGWRNPTSRISAGS